MGSYFGTPNPNISVIPPATNPMLELAALHQQYVKGIDALAMADPGQTPVTKRPWIDEPAGSVPFDPQGGIALPAAPSGDVIIVSGNSFPMVVPDGYDGVITHISCNFTGGGFTPFSGDIIWRLTINGRTVRNFDAILAEKGTTQIARKISPIRIYSGNTVNWVVNHAANGALNGQTIVSLTGYFYPSKGIS